MRRRETGENPVRSRRCKNGTPRQNVTGHCAREGGAAVWMFEPEDLLPDIVSCVHEVLESR